MEWGAQLKTISANAQSTEPEAISRQDWLDLSSRFKITQQYEPYAQWEKSPWKDDSWKLCGTDSRTCESLCQLAGAMLLKSPTVSKHLSEAVLSRTSPIDRWLDFVSEKTGFQKVDHDPVFVRTSDDELHCLQTGSMDFVFTRSAQACVQCSAEET